jgi:hypothetical protein
MKKLMFLISTEGKSQEQISKEVWQAYQKYLKVERKVESDHSEAANKSLGKRGYTIVGYPRPRE